MRARLRWVVVMAAASVLSTSCGTVTNRTAPTCVQRGADTLILMAQAVPSAEQVPCIAGYPAGWHFASMDVGRDRADFVLDSDRAGISAVRVTLREECDLEGATEIPSDEPNTRRFERILSVVNGFRAERTYQFEGGCATYRFNFQQRGQALVNEVSVALGFISRERLAEEVRARSGGHLSL